jgi:hypothetical protein
VNLKNHAKEIRQFVANGDFEQTPEGVLIHKGIRVTGRYHTTVNGKDPQIDENLIPTEGITAALGIWLGATAKHTAFYLAPFTGATAVLPTWTAATFPSLAAEVTGGTAGSGTGYYEAARQEWIPGVPAAGVIDNLASRAVFTIVCSPTLTITGMGLIADDSVKGGSTGGTLISASRYDNARTVNNADAFEVGYEVELTDS